MLKKTICCAGMLCIVAASTASLAKKIDLYEQPTDSAKVVGKINTETGFVPIFTQKDGKWTKVGDPETGSTGWVKAAELSAGTSGSFSYSQSMVSKNGEVPSMVIRFGKPKPGSQKELQEYLWKSRQQQEALHRDIQNMMQNFFNTQPEWMGFPYPMVLPVMVVPVQQDLPKENPAPRQGTDNKDSKKQ